MHLRIGVILPLIVSALAMMAVASSGFTAHQALGRREESKAFLEVNRISRLLLRSAGQWAVERGLTNAALKATEAISAERRAEIVKRRQAGDQAFREAIQQLRMVPAMTGSESQIGGAESTFRAFESVRGKVDETLTRVSTARPSGFTDSFMPTATNLIETSAIKLRLTLETLTNPPAASLSKLIGLRHLIAQMAEYAGRERALLAATIGTHSKLTADGIRSVASFRGQVDLAWGTIIPIAQRPGLPTKISDAIANVEREYFQIYGAVREGVLAAGEAGDYKISSSDYFSRATAAINSVLALADAIGNAADQSAENELAASTSNLVIAGIVLLVSIGLVLLSFWVVLLRILRPLTALTGEMIKLGDGHLDVVLPGLDRKDEIGDMAQAVEMFKVKASQKARDEVEAKVKQDQIAAQQRRADMIRLADDFEGAVGEIIETVSSASTELEASAGTLTSTAERAQEHTTAVAAASEEASTNVQSVASATEELSSSVNEISRQVQESSRIANEAVDQARRTNEHVGELSKAADSIGDVVKIISSIAGQTNLLALNATIEAARAGESGRGFSVVASEVKTLAEQTAKATGEISQHIAGIQVATQESVNAIKEISGTIERLSEISSVIAAAVEEQGAATQEISRNVQQAAQGTMQVSSSITDVQRGASETGMASSQVLSAAQSLSNDSNRLKLTVGKFLDTVRSA